MAAKEANRQYNLLIEASVGSAVDGLGMTFFTVGRGIRLDQAREGESFPNAMSVYLRCQVRSLVIRRFLQKEFRLSDSINA